LNERTKRTGSIFTLAPCSQEELDSLVERVFTSRNPRFSACVRGIITVCGRSPDGVATMPELEAELGASKSTIIGWMLKLQDLGILSIGTSRYYLDRKPVTSYTLQTPGREGPSPRPGTPQQLALASDDGTPVIPKEPSAHLRYSAEIDARMPWKGERFVVFSLLPVLRVGRTGSEVKQKAATVYMGEKYFECEVRAIEGGQIPSVLDLRPLIVAISLIKEFLDEAEGAEDLAAVRRFELSLSDICVGLGLPPIPGNKIYVHDQLVRWKTSSFKIKRSMRSPLKWAEGMFVYNQYFNILTELDVLQFAGKAGITPEFIALKLHEPIRLALKDIYRTLSIHEKILRGNPDPFMHLVYYWCRRVVQHDHHERSWPLAHLHRELRPTQEFRHFRRDFANMMYKYRLDLKGTMAAIPGYIISTGSDGEPLFRANDSDHIVGRGSPRARAKLAAGGGEVGGPYEK
jgi:hypothetical protein